MIDVKKLKINASSFMPDGGIGSNFSLLTPLALTKVKSATPQLSNAYKMPAFIISEIFLE